MLIQTHSAHSRYTRGKEKLLYILLSSLVLLIKSGVGSHLLLRELEVKDPVTMVNGSVSVFLGPYKSRQSTSARPQQSSGWDNAFHSLIFIKRFIGVTGRLGQSESEFRSRDDIHRPGEIRRGNTWFHKTNTMVVPREASSLCQVPYVNGRILAMPTWYLLPCQILLFRKNNRITKLNMVEYGLGWKILRIEIEMKEEVKGMCETVHI